MKRILLVFVWVLFTSFEFQVNGQDQSFSLSSIQTAAEQQAIQFAIDILNEQGNISSVNFSKKTQRSINSTNVDPLKFYSAYSIKPNVSIKAGTGDAFESIDIKASINLYKIKLDQVGGIYTPKSDELFHMFPISIGIESDASFKTTNGLIEAGWVPWFRPLVKNDPFLKSLWLGLFIQGGQKWSQDPTNEIGGAVDQSSEKEGEELFRAKGKLNWQIKSEGKQFMGYDLGISFLGIAWRDFVNNEWYSKLDVSFQLFVSDKHVIKFKYEKGSGAPNFNQGEQFGLGLDLMF